MLPWFELDRKGAVRRLAGDRAEPARDRPATRSGRSILSRELRRRGRLSAGSRRGLLPRPAAAAGAPGTGPASAPVRPSAAASLPLGGRPAHLQADPAGAGAKERKTRLILAARLTGKSAAETAAVMMAVFRRLDPRLRSSITFDNDTAFRLRPARPAQKHVRRDHVVLRRLASWQRARSRTPMAASGSTCRVPSTSTPWPTPSCRRSC